ncbi:hypothetical protein K502DRAFT_362369 [Neoconidiobolus thromboides FSU 785]|nr:hypothetical protein K502DRAFT_362369 [Neoconidiobolus thromboides FSU 785]
MIVDIYKIIYCFLIPSFKTYKAIKNEKELASISKFWFCLIAYLTLEQFIDIFFSWIFYYYEIKYISLFYITYPKLNGHLNIYDNVFHPFLVENEQVILDLTNEIYDLSNNIVTGFINRIKKRLGVSISKVNEAAHHIFNRENQAEITSNTMQMINNKDDKQTKVEILDNIDSKPKVELDNSGNVAIKKEGLNEVDDKSNEGTENSANTETLEEAVTEIEVKPSQE